jgi:ribosomal protein L29
VENSADVRQGAKKLLIYQTKRIKIMKKPKKRKTLNTKNYKELEKELDKIFSEYIRLRDADAQGFVFCITCGKPHYWSDGHRINCGHFLPRGRKATRFDERNCHGQCVMCNKWKSCEWDVYKQRMIELYGKEVVEELKQKSMTGISYNNNELKEKILEYREKVKQLKIEKGLSRK